MSFWNKKVYNVKGTAFGIDLSDLSVKVVELERNGKNDNLKSFGMAEIPSGCMIDGEIVDQAQVVAAIKKAIAGAKPKKIKAKKVICSLPETKAFLRIVNLPQMKHEEIGEAIKWEVEANIPLALDQVYYDWHLLEKNFSSEENKISVLIVAIARRVVDQFTEALEKAGLEAVYMGIESVAQARSLIDQREQDKTVLIIDVGDRRTSFSISLGGITCFTSSVPISGSFLTEAISRAMGVGFAEAEKVKFDSGIGSMEKGDPIFQAVSPVLENLSAEAEKAMDFYLNGLQYSTVIDRIILCGGGSKTKGLIDYLTKRLGKEIELGNPWVNLNFGKKIPAIAKDSAVQYSTAIGMAMRWLEE